MFYRDIENGNIYTIDDMQSNYREMISTHCIDETMSFTQYMTECMGKNGFIEKVGN